MRALHIPRHRASLVPRWARCVGRWVTASLLHMHEQQLREAIARLELFDTGSTAERLTLALYRARLAELQAERAAMEQAR